MLRARGQRWSGNINLGDDEWCDLPHWEELPEGIHYMSWQREVGEEGREHLQIYFETDKDWEIAKVKERFGGFWERAAGDAKSNKVYTSKQKGRVDGPWELGTPSKPGPVKGTMRKRAFQELDEHGYSATVQKHPELMAAVPGWLAKDYVSLMLLERRKQKGYVPPKILVIFGDTGEGKTQLAYEMYPKLYRISCKEKDIWWDGYNGEKHILLDDFYGQIKYSDMLQLLDGYMNRVQVKGGFTYLDNDVWIITSNKAPWEWWIKMEGSRQALYNRLWDRFDSCVVEFRAAPWNGMVIHDRPQ